MDAWVALDANDGVKYSHSVKDLFAFLHTLEEGFFAHARRMLAYGAADTLPLLLQLFSHTIVEYSSHIVQSAGLDAIPAILPTKQVKLKQAKAEPDNKDKAKAFIKGLFKDKDKSPTEEEEPSLPLDLPHSGLALQSIDTLCVRLACIEAAIVRTQPANTWLDCTSPLFCVSSSLTLFVCSLRCSGQRVRVVTLAGDPCGGAEQGVGICSRRASQAVLHATRALEPSI